jgi:hypothetical protein
VTDQFIKYCQVIAALQHESLRCVAGIAESPAAANAYEALKQRLLFSHQMTGYQRAERLFAMPTLGTRKPSELMAEMLEICPRGKEKSGAVCLLFLQRLPREIRVLLAKVDHKDPKELAEQTDHYWGLHDSPATVAAVLPAADNSEDALVAAVRQSGGGNRGGRGARGRSGSRGANRVPYESELSRDARLAAGLCLKHWHYGKHANGCEERVKETPPAIRELLGRYPEVVNPSHKLPR